MALDPSIILSGMNVDVLGAMSRGNALAAQVQQSNDQNALRSLYRTQGADILAGKPQALNALAGIDPQTALGIRSSQMDMQASQQRMDMLTREEQRSIEAYKAQASAQEAAAAAAQIEEAVKMGLAIPDAATWDQVMATQAPELVGQFANRQAFAMKYMSMAEALKAATPETYKPQSPQGKFAADMAAGVLPPGSKFDGGGTTVNVGDGNTSAFNKKADETAATRFNDIVTAGQSAQALTGDIMALSELAKNIGTGQGAAITAQLGPYADMLGVQIDGLSDMQAFNAIRDRMVPMMRVPGSGAASDFDARQFLNSLPSLATKPEGNKIISDTLMAVQQFKVEAANIANEAFSGKITWQEADRRISALGNPYEAFNASKARIQAGPDGGADDELLRKYGLK